MSNEDSASRVGASALPMRQHHERCRTRVGARAWSWLDYLLAAALAHLASVFRNGYAFFGASMVPLSEVLKGTMRP